MAKSFRRPKTDEEVKELEAAGLWKAQALTKKIGEGSEKITLQTISRIHKVFFKDVNPDMAGRFRKVGEDFKKLKCIYPPPGQVIQEKMYEFWRELDTRLSSMPPRPKTGKGKADKKELRVWNERILELAAWTQYKMASIHPFCEGNGRMARLMTNLILYRYNLQPSDIKYEGENKARYLDALCAMDNQNDIRPLKELITKGIIASYQKLLAAQKTAQKNRKIH